jgi:hypothetical protein
MPLLKMNDPVRRLAATRAALLFWALQGARQLVIADATGQTVLSGDDLAQIAALGCAVEQIAFQQDTALVMQRGKGFAEGQLIAFALEHSKILRRAPAFWKCTGKVFCRNFAQVTAAAERLKLTRLVWYGSYSGIDFRLADVRFWLSDPAFCREVMLPAYAGAHDPERVAEAVMIAALTPRLRNARLPRPRLTGLCGGLDEPYPEHSLGDLDHIFPCMTGSAADPRE